MNKKILFGSVLAAFLIVSIPFISVAQEQQANETQTTELITDEALIQYLQIVHDYCVENHTDEFEEGFLEEFQENIDALNIILLGNGDYPGGICAVTWLIHWDLIGIIFLLSMNPILGFSLLFLVWVIRGIAWYTFGCPWAAQYFNYDQSTYETNACDCASISEQQIITSDI